MHVPDHLVSPEIAITSAVAASVVVGAAIWSGRTEWNRSHVGMSAATAALIFGAQMVNYPVLPGTSGHLVGGVLAAALVGPSAAIVVMSVVLTVQAVLFGDGGVSALGINVLLMAALPVAVYAAARRLPAQLPRWGAVIGAAFLSVPVSALALCVLCAVGGVPDAGAMFAPMLGVHAVIGFGEAAITVIVLAAVHAVAPAVASWDSRRSATPVRTGRAVALLWASAMVCAGGLAFVASSFADGLESVLEAQSVTIGPQLFTGVSALADYGAVSGMPVGLVGIIGVAATAAVVLVLVLVLGRVPLAPAGRAHRLESWTGRS